jgi:hypothetical protein
MRTETGAVDTAWVGAVSFEERCVGSLVALAADGQRIDRAILLDYPTKAAPAAVDQARRGENADAISRAVLQMSGRAPERRQIAPYASESLWLLLEEIANEMRPTTVFFDISCLTKVHAISLAAALASEFHHLRWRVAYTMPESYGDLAAFSASSSWRDIIIGPVAESAVLFNEAQSRGIIVPGHEGDRLVVALAELEPSGGLVLFGDAKGRPDLRRLSEQKNQRILRHLIGLRSGSWTQARVGVADWQTAARLVAKEIELARRSDAPIILFPFGPKSLLFVIAAQLAAEYPEASWFVYPVPSMYDANYSEGIGRTVWIAREALPSVGALVEQAPNQGKG